MTNWVEFGIPAGHAPDLPPADPRAWTVCGLRPYASGFGTNYPWSEVGAASAMNTTHCGGAEVQKVDGTRRYFFGTTTKIYEWDGVTTMTDRAGAAYGAATTDPWSFAQFGDITLAVNRTDRLQQINAGAAFADAHATAPKASIVICAGPMSTPFVILFDYNDGAATRDGWYCSPTPTSSWATSIAAQVANGRLLIPTEGPILNAIAFREGALAFKKNATFLGSYVGPDAAWGWTPVDWSIGCIGKQASVNADGAVYFAGPRGFYVFDGSYPRPLPGFVHETWAQFYSQVIEPGGLQHYVKATYDSEAKVVSFFMTASLTGGTGNVAGILNATYTPLAFEYNIITQQWAAASFAQFASNGADVPIGLISARVGATGNKKPSKMNTAATTSTLGLLRTPRIGGAGNTRTLHGLWPVWQNGSRFGTTFGPAYPATSWTGPGGESFSKFWGFSKPNLATPDTEKLATINAAHARLDGRAEGRWVQVETTLGVGLGIAQFASVLLDLRDAPRGSK